MVSISIEVDGQTAGLRIENVAPESTAFYGHRAQKTKRSNLFHQNASRKGECEYRHGCQQLSTQVANLGVSFFDLLFQSVLLPCVSGERLLFSKEFAALLPQVQSAGQSWAVNHGKQKLNGEK